MGPVPVAVCVLGFVGLVSLLGSLPAQGETEGSVVVTTTSGEEGPAVESPSYSCPPMWGTFKLDRRIGNTCHYKKVLTKQKPASTFCPSTWGTFTLDRRSGNTCHYKKVLTKSSSATSTVSYSCPSTWGTFSLDRRSGSTCHYKKVLTKSKTVSPSQSCPSKNGTYDFDRRVGNTCHYKKVLTKSKAATSTVSYSCPPMNGTYGLDRRVGNTCHYKKVLTKSKSVSYLCPPMNGTYGLDRRVGNTCHYKKVLRKWKTATKVPTTTAPTSTTSTTTLMPGIPSIPKKPSVPGVPPITLAVPTGLEADGDSRGNVSGNGRVTLKWSAVRGATSYEVTMPKSGSSVVQSTEKTVSSLTPKQLYSFRVRARNAMARSTWSDLVYGYPTFTPAGKGDKIGIVPIGGYRSSPPRFDYIMCTNYLSASDSTRITEVSRSVWIWFSATGAVNGTRLETKKCSSGTKGKPVSNMVYFVPKSEIMATCEVSDPGTPACIQHHTSADGEIKYSRIVLSLANATSKSKQVSGDTCSQLFQISMHEVAHTFGLHNLPTGVGGKTVMGNDMYDYCLPQAYDVVAIKAIYQSRRKRSLKRGN